MKAVIYVRYGPPEVLTLRNVEKPRPRDNEVLVRIYATAVTSGDVHLRKADPFAVRLFFGLLKPRKNILGFALAGKVEETGAKVKRFETGDAVFGTTGMRFGAYAEYVCLPENAVLAGIPANLNFEEAAAIPFGSNTALYFLRKGNIQSGQKVLIYGASGAVGTAAVQLAIFFGATVTGVCSTANVRMVKELGAHKVIDYTKEDFSKTGDTFDMVFDTVGKSAFAACIRSLNKNGVLVSCDASPSFMARGWWASLTGSKKVITGVMHETPEDMQFVKELVEAGKLKPVIDRRYPLEQVAEAHRYVEQGHKKGNVVVTV
ncbi:NAD(P)-dependent alcohol dehydrogenase [Pontibacter sp. E15-1]|uniref:NAD(P)-dependent alcohol dehydrogenase n=1 Tax=Pontibacter sp. E15-1 TaxID=2919918 RepID=UPI001F4F28BB|nr:NAD(P)-dependent alcohol dehydrogenase [Pontibacter sp. E15-1]MCJ8164133.1 NAD(P)-dependent alcohol dehydrogenase [Pontibacter sp. E15-1]